MKPLGVVLVILGALGLYFRAIPYTRREQVLDIGPLQATADVHRELPVPPWVSLAALGVGVGLLWMPARKSSRRRR